MKIILTLALVCLSFYFAKAQSNWPYRNQQNAYYYGAPQRPSGLSGYYDDEAVSDYRGLYRQAEVNKEQESQDSGEVIVLQTGSLAPIQPVNNKKKVNSNQQKVTQPVFKDKRPVFPPFKVYPGPPPSESSSSSESSESYEDDYGDNDDDNDDLEYSSESDESDERRRKLNVKSSANDTGSGNDAIEGLEKDEMMNATVAENKKAEMEEKEMMMNEQKMKPQPLEALVPGYITDQGEVLVPIDTVQGSAGPEAGDITIFPDPAHPVLRGKLAKKKEEKKKVVEKKVNDVTFYSRLPPPGAIFTFDDDEEDDDEGPQLFRQDVNEADSSEEDEEETKKKTDKIPLVFVSATAPSGEDDENDAIVKAEQAIIKNRNKEQNDEQSSSSSEEEDYFGPPRSRQGYNFPPSRTPINPKKNYFYRAPQKYSHDVVYVAKGAGKFEPYVYNSYLDTTKHNLFASSVARLQPMRKTLKTQYINIHNYYGNDNRPGQSYNKHIFDQTGQTPSNLPTPVFKTRDDSEQYLDNGFYFFQRRNI